MLGEPPARSRCPPMLARRPARCRTNLSYSISVLLGGAARARGAGFDTGVFSAYARHFSHRRSPPIRLGPALAPGAPLRTRARHGVRVGAGVVGTTDRCFLTLPPPAALPDSRHAPTHARPASSASSPPRVALMRIRARLQLSPPPHRTASARPRLPESPASTRSLADSPPRLNCEIGIEFMIQIFHPRFQSVQYP
ncbi:hypothetical protein B0H15DRAFT_1026272 [Mycena belliarum]|uniref:Uncharacterized protein n=1 Tax=Mycena belliarum TaxID=1033014 RepID=A0AAD6TSX6_9AGAR|nr:hypothetical protein B0H15DRAFT_1026272 [Mycena belliae]